MRVMILCSRMGGRKFMKAAVEKMSSKIFPNTLNRY